MTTLGLALLCRSVPVAAHPPLSRTSTSTPLTAPALPEPASLAAAGSLPAWSLTAADLRSGRLSGDRAEARLRTLAAALAALPADKVSLFAHAFLSSGEDADTGTGLIVTTGGVAATPTLRSWLLEAWYRLDRDGARQAGWHIAAAPHNAAEWALALRNHVDGDAATVRDPATASLLQAGLLNADWASTADAGWLEAHDFLVLAADAGAFNLLASLHAASTPGSPARHAATLGAERFADRHPATTLAALAGNPGLFRDDPALAGRLAARADPADAAQSNALTTWLRNADPAAARGCLAVFPLRLHPAGPALATPAVAVPTLAASAAADRLSVALIDAWSTDPLLARHATSIAPARHRLAALTASAARGGF